MLLFVVEFQSRHAGDRDCDTKTDSPICAMVPGFNPDERATGIATDTVRLRVLGTGNLAVSFNPDERATGIATRSYVLP